MICLSRSGEHRKDLDELTESQLADIDRLLMIVWKTRPQVCSADNSIVRGGQIGLEAEELPDFQFLLAGAL